MGTPRKGTPNFGKPPYSYIDPLGSTLTLSITPVWTAFVAFKVLGLAARLGFRGLIGFRVKTIEAAILLGIHKALERLLELHSLLSRSKKFRAPGVKAGGPC